MVRIKELDDDAKWLLEISSDEHDDEIILIGVNGRVVLRSLLFGQDLVLYEGFAEERDVFYNDDGGEGN